MRKNVRGLLHQGYYDDKTDEEFASDAVEWAGEFRGIESYVKELIRKGYQRDQILDSLCDYAMNSLVL